MPYLMPSPETVEKIARVCHEANRAHCINMGDYSQVEWDDADDWQKESAQAGVVNIFMNPKTEPGDGHQVWMDKKIADGWVYGEVKDAEKKTHPSLLPFEKLSKDEQLKDVLFVLIVRAHFPK